MLPTDAIISMIFEGTSALVVFIALYFAIIIYRKYPRLTRVGWIEIMSALLLFGMHLFLDMIDTLIYVRETKRPFTLFGHTAYIRPEYTIIDWCENTFAVLALVLLIVGFLRLSNHMYRLWRGEK